MFDSAVACSGDLCVLYFVLIEPAKLTFDDDKVAPMAKRDMSEDSELSFNGAGILVYILYYKG